MGLPLISMLTASTWPQMAFDQSPATPSVSAPSTPPSSKALADPNTGRPSTEPIEPLVNGFGFRIGLPLVSRLLRAVTSPCGDNAHALSVGTAASAFKKPP